jgi:hypothetical protein
MKHLFVLTKQQGNKGSNVGFWKTVMGQKGAQMLWSRIGAKSYVGVQRSGDLDSVHAVMRLKAGEIAFRHHKLI